MFVGIKDVLNAIAVDDIGGRTFFYERSNRCIIEIDINSGDQKTIKFSDKDLLRQRWLCYSMFYYENANSSTDPTQRISILWYNQVKKKFCLTIHRLTLNSELTLIGEKLYLTPIDIPFDRLGYSAQQKDSKIEAVFYEIKAAERQKFWFFDFDVKLLKLVRTKNGLLPTGHFELPFLSEQALHFLVVRKTQSLLATLQLSEEESEWSVSDILPDSNSPIRFSRRALWCNYWHQQICIFLVSRCVEGRTKADIWALDIRTAAWKHIKTVIDSEREFTNFAIRLFDKNHLFIHYDSTEEALFLRVDNLIREIKNIFAGEAYDESVGIGLADVICPICLENYENPKTLNCGHSLCNSHLSHLATSKEAKNAIRCPVCRCLSFGNLPTNYALQDAMEMLNKIRRSQTFDQRCANCRLTCTDEELWHCLDCNDSNQNICANCILKYHEKHQLQSYNKYKEELKEVENIGKEMETQALALYQNFQEELMAKFQSSVYEKICHLHKDCLLNYFRTNNGRLNEVQKRKAMCLKHFNFVFEEILRSTDGFVSSLEDSLFVENACSALEALQKSTEI